MAATIKDIAKLTGLGLATVSAYLNGVTVRPKNREAIESAIDELGYVRNEYARGLKTRRSMTIGVLIPELSNVFSTSIISEMEDVLRSRGYGIIVSDCRSDKELESKSLQFLMSKMVDGLIVMPISTDGKLFDKAVESGLPVVVIDRLTSCKGVSHVIINNREAAKLGVQKLLEKGHRRIAIVTGSADIYTAYERYQGYREALEEANCYDETLYYNGGLAVDQGYLAMKEIIANHDDVTALFVTNYEMTVGAIIAINELGKSIPRDYSLVGFDNMELAKVFNTPLATVNQPLIGIGRMSANEILRLMDKGEPCVNVLTADIVEGNSIKQI